jgi:hypothetical protein
MIPGASLPAVQPVFADNHEGDAGTRRIELEMQREIAVLPFHGLFDHFAFRVDGETVTLTGKVSRPALKSDTENAWRWRLSRPTTACRRLFTARSR